jgi:hypothetical protein
MISHGWPKIFWLMVSLSILWANDIRIGYSIPDHSIWKRMPWGEAEMHSFSYTNDQVLYNQFSPYFLCRVSWLPIITNLDSLSQIRLNEYQLKSISFNYNICGIWKIFNNTRQRKYCLIILHLLTGMNVIASLLFPAHINYCPRWSRWQSLISRATINNKLLKVYDFSIWFGNYSDNVVFFE